MNQQNYEHDRISPTAKLVAYWRSFSDIPFSKDIASLFNVEEVVKSVFKTPPNNALDDLLVPLVEIRYKCIQNLILKRNIKQVLEFASGISLRGLAMTSDKNLTYVETDLPELNEEKIEIIKKIRQKYKISENNNLFFHAVNIFNKQDIERSLQHFDINSNIAIINEGLFQYLNFDEKKQAALNIHEILKRFGGIWVTPDFDTKSDRINRDIDKDHFEPIMKAIAQSTGRSFLDNSFEDEEDINNFFSNLGFTITKIPQFDNNIKLSTYKNKTLSPALSNMLRSLNLWILRADTK